MTRITVTSSLNEFIRTAADQLGNRVVNGDEGGGVTPPAPSHLYSRACIIKRLWSQESIPPGWESIPGLLKRFLNSGSGSRTGQIFKDDMSGFPPPRMLASGFKVPVVIFTSFGYSTNKQ
jgi:hypothetical protein